MASASISASVNENEPISSRGRGMVGRGGGSCFGVQCNRFELIPYPTYNDGAMGRHRNAPSWGRSSGSCRFVDGERSDSQTANDVYLVHGATLTLDARLTKSRMSAEVRLLRRLHLHGSPVFLNYMAVDSSAGWMVTSRVPGGPLFEHLRNGGEASMLEDLGLALSAQSMKPESVMEI